MDSFRNVLLNRQPSLVWKHFYAISRNPHCSKHEEKLRKYIVDLAHSNGLETRVDEAGNLTVTRPASAGLAGRPGIVLQAHLDMVCEKDADLDFDFSKQAIQLKIDGDWLMADGTTLGADNGIGVAVALAVLEDRDLELPQVEALFTVSEEIGLIGATNLAADMVSGQILINLDTENVDTFYIGCAGGCNTILDLPMETDRISPTFIPVRIVIDGLAGGHSGVEIHQGRANALKLMGRLLDAAAAAAVELRLVRVDGGKSLNVIPRQAEALALVPHAKLTALKEQVSRLRTVFKAEVTQRDAGLDARVIEGSSLEETTAMTTALRDRTIGLLVALPYGPTQLDQTIPGLVRTSTNLAAVATEPHRVVISTKQRGSEDSEMMALSRSIEKIGVMAGATVRKNGHYTGWNPDPASPLLQRAKKIFTRINGQPPGVASIHAGLECGLLGDKFPGLDMLSIGATIHNAHSPQEKLSLSSVDKLWTFLIELLKDLTRNTEAEPAKDQPCE